EGTAAPGWPSQGRSICGAAGNQWTYQRPIIPDGAGGALIAWQDTRDMTSFDIYVQRVLGNGAIGPQWPEDGKLMCGAVGDQTRVCLAPNGSGGAIVAWQDTRVGPGISDIYAARVNPDGTTPVLLSLVSANATPERVLLRWNDAG